MKKMNPVVHFEMPAKDRNRVADFYTKVFGWQAKFFGPDMGNYVTVATTETDDQGMIKTPGAINGGFYTLTDDGQQANSPSVVIAVENIGEASKRITERGGKLLGEPMDIPGVGKWQSFEDTEGNRVSILQPLRA